MKGAPPLLPIFRSPLQGRLLAAVLLRPDQESSLTQLAGRLGANLASVQREADRLERAGVFTSRRVGNVRLVRADPTSPVADELAALVLKVFGPADVLGRLLANVEGVEEAWIFGSWAQRYEGVPGEPPQDLDLLVVGTADRDAVYRAAAAAQERLGLEVNATVRSREAWEAAADGFLRHVRGGPLVAVPLRDDPR